MMTRRQNIPRPRERTWDEVSDLGKIYVSSEVILYSIEDIVNMTRWSYTTVKEITEQLEQHTPYSSSNGTREASCKG